MVLRTQLALLFVLICTTPVRPHGASIDVLVNGQGQLTPFLFGSGVPIDTPSDLSYFPLADRIIADSPGLGIVNEANGVAANTLIKFQVSSPLIYWDGNAIERPDGTLTVASPDGIGEYVVSADSGAQSGMNWGIYPGGTFWDEHGFYFLDPVTSGEGLYGIWVELASPTYETSDPFLIPFLYAGEQSWDRETIDLGIQKLLEHDWLQSSIPGDFNQDGRLDASDIDALTSQVNSGNGHADFDLNDDQRVDDQDRTIWVEDLANTYFGDSNLDGEFNSGDLISVLQQGEYEDNLFGNSTWSSGDWNGDSEFDTSDLVKAFGAAGYEAGPRAAIRAVPEPVSTLCLSGGLLLMVGWLRHSRR